MNIFWHSKRRDKTKNKDNNNNNKESYDNSIFSKLRSKSPDIEVRSEDNQKDQDKQDKLIIDSNIIKEQKIKKDCQSSLSENKGFFTRVFEKLTKTKNRINETLDAIILGRSIDNDLLEDLEEVLLSADLGVKVTTNLIESIKNKVNYEGLKDIIALKQALRIGIEEILIHNISSSFANRVKRPHVIIVVGVNGVGKTTSVAKLAYYFKNQGLSVILGGADTFRVAATEQLTVWARRVGCEIVVAKRHISDSSAVVYDTIETALNKNFDIVIIDTAGRLHTKIGLMDEISKIQKVTAKCLPGAPHEVLLVLDANIGQNAINQVKSFHKFIPLTGLILSKIDGTAKGGVVIAIAVEMNIPILFIGIGEGLNDLKEFDPYEFTRAIF